MSEIFAGKRSYEPGNLNPECPTARRTFPYSGIQGGVMSKSLKDWTLVTASPIVIKPLSYWWVKSYCST